MIYELRIYDCVPGRLPALLARFEQATLTLWEKHGIRQVGFWATYVGPSSHRLTYLLQWESLAEREQKWDKFQTDPEWVAKRAASEVIISGGTARRPTLHRRLQSPYSSEVGARPDRLRLGASGNGELNVGRAGRPARRRVYLLQTRRDRPSALARCGRGATWRDEQRSLRGLGAH